MNEVMYLKEVEVARITQRPVATLRNDRVRGRGIPYIRVGRSVRYSLNDVIQFMESRKVQTEENEAQQAASKECKER